MKNLYDLPCNIAQILNIIGDKWTLLIVRQLMEGKTTYKEIQNHLEGIPSNLLSKRLKVLEEDGIITTRLYQSHPPRYEYLLTESGRDLNDIFISLLLWGKKHVEGCDKVIIHSECGHPLEHRYYCSHCQRIVEKEEMDQKNNINL